MYFQGKDYYSHVIFDPKMFPDNMKETIEKQNKYTIENIKNTQSKSNKNIANPGTGTYNNDKSSGNWHQAYYDNNGFTMNSRYW